jgi:hypothetical protein
VEYPQDGAARQEASLLLVLEVVEVFAKLDVVE